MSNVKFANIESELERKTLLENNCDFKTEDEIKRPLTTDQINEVLADFRVNASKKAKLESQISDLKSQLKPIESSIKMQMAKLASGVEITNEEVFHFKDFGTGMLETYDKDGSMIGFRKLRPDEMQSTLMSQARKAVNE
jgi:ribosome maturation protein Sdo1